MTAELKSTGNSSAEEDIFRGGVSLFGGNKKTALEWVEKPPLLKERSKRWKVRWNVLHRHRDRFR
jgi:hypothetical protein